MRNCHYRSHHYTANVKIPFVFIVWSLLAAALVAGCNRETTRVDSPIEESSALSNAPTADTPVAQKYDKLRGRWERPDGGYVIEIRSADSEGRLEANYFNPASIKVSQARAYQEGGVTKVFVELRDVNYPGCTYKLAYNAQSDQLFGQYFQATMQETYDVTFGRMK